MANVFIFTISFAIIFIVMLILYFRRKKSGELKNSKEVLILHHRFKVKKKNINPERLGLLFSFIYSFIVAITGTIISELHFGYLWNLLVALAMLIILIYISFAFTAIYLKSKRKEKTK